MENTVKKLEKLADRIKTLSREYKEAKEAEGKKYHLLQDLKCLPIKRFMLIDRANGQIKCYGPSDRLKSYCRLRNIDQSQVVISKECANMSIFP